MISYSFNLFWPIFENEPRTFKNYYSLVNCNRFFPFFFRKVHCIIKYVRTCAMMLKKKKTTTEHILIALA